MYMLYAVNDQVPAVATFITYEYFIDANYPNRSKIVTCRCNHPRRSSLATPLLSWDCNWQIKTIITMEQRSSTNRSLRWSLFVRVILFHLFCILPVVTYPRQLSELFPLLLPFTPLYSPNTVHYSNICPEKGPLHKKLSQTWSITQVYFPNIVHADSEMC